MKSLIYWMVFQMLIGAWLFVSPFVTGFRELTEPSILNMALGVITVLIGLATVLYEVYQKNENSCDRGEPQENTL